MQQIKTLLDDNDIAGIVLLHNIETAPVVTNEGVHVQGFTEYLINISPSYSAASINNERLKVLAKAVHYPSKTDRDIKMASTVNMINHLREGSSNLAMTILELNSHITHLVESCIPDKPNHSTDIEQNN